MANEIIYVCNSTNNKNVRDGELNILRKIDNKLCIEFGENEMNIKRRFYNDSKTLNKDYDALVKLKEKPSKISEDKSEEKKEDSKMSENIEDIKSVNQVVDIEEKGWSSITTKYKIPKKKK